MTNVSNTAMYKDGKGDWTVTFTRPYDTKDSRDMKFEDDKDYTVFWSFGTVFFDPVTKKFSQNYELPVKKDSATIRFKAAAKGFVGLLMAISTFLTLFI